MASPRRFHELGVEAQEKEDAKIAARRARNAARTAVFMDARQRTTGNDFDTLAAQIAEKKRTAAAERDEEHARAEALARTVGIVAALEKETAAQRQRRAADLAASLAAQVEERAAAARAGAGAGLPIRADRDAGGCDPDPRLGVSSAQVFDGEDPLRAARLRTQHSQMVAWTQRALSAKAETRAEAAAREAAHAAAAAESLRVGEELEARAAAAARERAAAVAAANADLAAAKSARLAEASARDRQADAEALATTTTKGPDGGAGYHFLAGDLSDSLAPGGRIRVDHYRGLPPAAGAQTQAAVAGQIAEHVSLVQRKREAAAADYAELQRTIIEAARIERATTSARESARRETVAALQRQKDEAAARRQRDAAERTGAATTDDFFKRFGTSDR